MRSFVLRRTARLLPLLIAPLLYGAETAPPVASSLSDGLTQEREIRGGETQTYTIELQTGQFLRITVQEKGIDLTVRLVDSKGVLVAWADSMSLGGNPRELEDLAAIVGGEGPYRIEIDASKQQPTGRYTLHVEGPRASQETDKLRIEAVKATWVGLSGNGDEKVRALDRAAALWHELHEDRKEAQILFVLGQEHYAQNRYPQAVRSFEQSAAFWEHDRDPQARSFQALALTWTGLSLQEDPHGEDAKRRFEGALEAARASGDIARLAWVLNHAGNFYSENGESPKALQLLKEALELFRKTGNQKLEASVLVNLGAAYLDISEPQESLRWYKEALVLARRTGDSYNEAAALNNLGEIYILLGDGEEALRYNSQALALSRRAKDRDHQAAGLNNVGLALQRLGRLAEAGASFQAAESLAREIGNAEIEAKALNNLANLKLKLGKAGEARELARRALLRVGNHKDAEGDARHALGLADWKLKDLQGARDELTRAVEISRLRGDLRQEAYTMLALAQVEKDAGELKAALSDVDASVRIIESLRAQVVSQDLRASFLAAKKAYYELYVDILMALHKADPGAGYAADAFKVNEKARARSLLEILNEASADLRQGIPPALLERERRLREKVSVQEIRRRELLGAEKVDADRVARAERDLEDAREEYRTVQEEIRLNSPGYAALTQPQPLNSREVQDEVLNGQAVLLEYALGSERSYLWLITPAGLESFELPKREVIEAQARRYYELIIARNDLQPDESLEGRRARIAKADADAQKVGRQLSSLLLQPVARRLGDAPLLVVADGALQYIPFAALPIPGSEAPLATRHEVVSLPSASALAVLRREMHDRVKAPRALAIFADPVFSSNDERLRRPGVARTQPAPSSPAHRGIGDREVTAGPSRFSRLSFSRREADIITALLPRDQVFKALDFDASRATVLSTDLTQFRNVHFATHGVVDSQRPDLSSLVLSQVDKSGRRQDDDGHLRLNDIYNLRLDADLVVLSACRTALGKEVRGEGLIGLTRGFMYAGAARVLASLWSVEDRATAELMGSFYRGMLREGLSPTAALRKAQLEMARDPKRKSPYYWAGFSLQGEWR